MKTIILYYNPLAVVIVDTVTGYFGCEMPAALRLSQKVLGNRIREQSDRRERSKMITCRTTLVRIQIKSVERKLKDGIDVNLPLLE